MCHVFKIVPGNSNIPQQSIVEGFPGRSHTADFRLKEHSAPKPYKDRNGRDDPCTPASEDLGRESWRALGRLAWAVFFVISIAVLLAVGTALSAALQHPEFLDVAD
jgi:hypothetical protein